MKYGRFSLEPLAVPRVETEHRRIVTAQPAPGAVPVFERLLASEPPSMACQPPVLWDRAHGYQVEDRFGNRWIDWSSCVLVANAGHGHPTVTARIEALTSRPLLSTYVFAHEGRAELCERLAAMAPDGLDRVYLLTTGSEAIECAIKLMRTWGRRTNDGKKVIVSFSGSFHGRTLGSQYAGGIAPLKSWIGVEEPTFVQVPFPDGYLVEDTSFEVFLRSLDELGVSGDEVAGVMSESYLGVGPDFFPTEYALALRRWCDRHGALLAFDEVQSGFGRSGKLFTYEHYVSPEGQAVIPDIIVCGKGISGSLPLSAVIGRSDVLSTYGPGSMTSTHSGSPLPIAAGLGCLDVMESEGLVARAAEMEVDMVAGCERIEKAFGDRVGCIRARGLVGGIRVVRPGTKEPDSDLTHAITEDAYRRGLLMFAPVGLGGGCLKIVPPLTIPRDALIEGFDVLEEAFEAVLSGASRER